MKKHHIAWRSFGQGDDVRAAVVEVAEKLRVDDTTVRRNLRKLQRLGLIEVTKQFKNGRQRTNLYTFPTPQWWVEGCHVDITKAQVRQGGHFKGYNY